MARIRKIEIVNFRGIRSLLWCPAPGINCLIGPGDSGKSTIVDAIDLCLGARRNVQFSDADFFALNVHQPIRITLTLGDIDDSLRSLEGFGLFIRGFNLVTGFVEDEPGVSCEPVITMNLIVQSDLEPSWVLYSDRAAQQGLVRSLAWKDRLALAPTRLGATSDYNLGWQRGSVLNRISEERADASAALVAAARDARTRFGDQAEVQLGAALTVVTQTAHELGIDIGARAKALLDSHSVSFSGGTISLHSETGIPLKNLGVGSSRLLIAGLQKKAAQNSTVVLADELEFGLEPQRIIRFLGSLGAKETPAPIQAFLTTHSPVALRELSGTQLFLLRQEHGTHVVRPVGSEDDIQGTIRLYPEAFLASSVIVCEGASEVGLVRGLDLYRQDHGMLSLAAQGVALADCAGGSADRPFERASAFQKLGYRVMVLRDDDLNPTQALVKDFTDNGGTVVSYRAGRTLEDELFLSSTPTACQQLITYADELHGELIHEHLKSESKNSLTFGHIWEEIKTTGQLADERRAILGKAARTKKAGWFKSVTWMEHVARAIVGPDLQKGDPNFLQLIDGVFHWITHGPR